MDRAENLKEAGCPIAKWQIEQINTILYRDQVGLDVEPEPIETMPEHNCSICKE